MVKAAVTKRSYPSPFFWLLLFSLGLVGIWGVWSLAPSFGVAATGEGPLPPPPLLASEAAVLLDAPSGALLMTERAHAKLPPGELTKIVTAWVLFQGESLPAEATISRDAIGAPGASLNLHEGQVVPVETLLYALLHRPGAGSAVALAEHAAGSVDAFVIRMNLAAERLGAHGTRFANPHGLDVEGHWSTAYDMAQFAKVAAGDEKLKEALASARAKGMGEERGRLPINSFLLREPRAASARTSYTPKSGYSLVAFAAQGERELLLILLGAPSAEARLRDAQALLDYAFAHYERLLAEPRVDRLPYQVRPGDTLSGLAQRFEVPIAAIRALNGLSDPDQLSQGQTLWIPR